MSVGSVLLDEKTRVSISIATLLFVIGFSITGTFTFTTWKTQFETTQQSEIIRLTNEISERKVSDNDILKEVNMAEALLLETQTSLTDIDIKVETGFARIYTSLEWIINDLRSDK